MKKKILIAIMLLFIPQVVFAEPNASISTSENIIENGKAVNVSVTLNDTAAWNIKITGSGAATCSQKEADVTSDGKSTTKVFSLPCTSNQEGTITFTVTGDITSESGQTKDISLSKQVTVTRAKSSDNSLSDLKVDGTTVAGFSGAKTSYSISDKTANSINITASPTDSNATVAGTGNKNLRYGSNTFDITVTAENGSQKIYKITVNKPDTRSSNTYLKSLTVSEGTINFNRNNTSYSIKVEHNVSSVSINASAEDSKSTISGTGTKPLNDYSNEFKIVVTAENGASKTYSIIVERKDANGFYVKQSTDNSVRSISVPGYQINFNNNTKKYNVLVDENINQVDIKVEPNDPKSKVNITNNTDLKAGLNKVIVQVTAENGDVNEFLFNVYKIGDEPKEEIVDPTPTPSNNEEAKQDKKEEPKKEGFNIWIVISLLELIAIVILIILFKKNNTKSNNQLNEESDNSLDSNTTQNTNEVENSNIEEQ